MINEITVAQGADGGYILKALDEHGIPYLLVFPTYAKVAKEMKILFGETKEEPTAS